MALQNFFFVTVRRESPSAGSDRAIPGRKLILASNVFGSPITNLKRGGSVLKLREPGRGTSKYEIFETVAQFNTASEPTNTNSAPDANLTVAAAGANLAAATLLSAYYNIVTTATASTADGVRLPAASGRRLTVIVNRTAVALRVYPNAAGEALVDRSGIQQANGASLTIQPGETWHFVSTAGSVSRAAVDY